MIRTPDRLLSDNGPEFRSSLFTDLLCTYGIKHITTTPYQPSSNGCVERVNRSVTEILRNLATSSSWDKELARAVIIYNHTRHSELQMSPAEYLLTKKHVVIDTPVVTTEDLMLWSPGNPRFKPFAVGDLVRKKINFGNRCVKNKFQPRFEGPYEVVQVHDNKVTYKIRPLHGGNVVPAHHNQLATWKTSPAYLNFDTSKDLGGDVTCSRSELSEASLVSSETSLTSLLSSSSDSTGEFSGFVQPNHAAKFPDTSPVNELNAERDSTSSCIRTEGRRHKVPTFDMGQPFPKSCTAGAGEPVVDLQSKDGNEMNGESSKLHSGVVLPVDGETWDMSSISSVKSLPEAKLMKREKLYLQVAKFVKNYIIKLLDEACDRVVVSPREQSMVQEDGSFSGFAAAILTADEDKIATPVVSTDEEALLSRTGCERLQNSVCDAESGSTNCDKLAVIPDFRPVTRSRGLVADLPNVMDVPVEYVKSLNK
ncbi:uncharacterized protein LOC108669343 [Hyalella azteca]|uniref:Uncharacterized protein LOC108669343 n=1 Tax=Hyalella azteca TaxID=294128 RepID=A0A8B7NFC2_HYAAZ|nr:uncharacterized protein LOC108669343 [Hyalella azteca]